MTALIVPPEPRLDWKALRWGRRKVELPPPFNITPTHYMFSGRTAIYHGLGALEISAGQSVLVPAFHCASLVDPILRRGATAAFYRVNPDCSPDFDDIRRRVDATTRAIVAIHYFGFPQPLGRFRELCAERGLYLIEDCAHVLAGRSESTTLGATGDISIFSWRKFLPLYDGGQLVVNNRALAIDIKWDRPGFVARVKAVKDVFDRLVNDSPTALARYINHLERLPSIVGRYLQSKRARPGRSPIAMNSGARFDLGFPFTMVNLPMSAFSRFVVDHIDLQSIVARRRFNYVHLLRTLGSLSGVIPLFPDLPDGVCPLAFPFFVEGRKDFHLRLRSFGLPASTWGNVIHPDLPLEEFPDSRTLYDKLIYLPVHQSLTMEEMSTMGHAMQEALFQTP